MMSRPVALGLVLLVLILTSQSDWKQEPKADLEAANLPVTKQHQLLRTRETVKKEIILIQEKEIYTLKLQVKSLENQLSHCICETGETITEKAATMQNESWQVEKTEGFVEPHSVVSSKLRGSGSGTGLSGQPLKETVTQTLSDESVEMAEEEEEKIEDR